ncbi:MAG: nucleotide exchange factor GrpE, partial [Deltaproteobacteria bacterium]|nr:nucleotide exchange factor GrpE [Deltaproteobacteria bacterium]
LMPKFYISKFVKRFRRYIFDKVLLPIMKWSSAFLSAKIKGYAPESAEAPTSKWKKKVIEDFQVWLREMPEEMPINQKVDMDSCDLYTLLMEFTALRQEIKFQNREQNNTLRIQQSFIDSLKETLKLLKDRTSKLETLEERIRLSSEKKAVLPFIDIRDGLIRGLKAAKVTAATKRLFVRSPRGIEGIIEGYEMALRRFDRALSYVGITPVIALGRPFDLVRMRAVGQESDSQKEAGIVIEEQVGGFVRQNEVIRTAEVIVNK